MQPTHTPKVLVAIPAYNCERQITRVLGDFDERLLARLHKVLVIDNCSKDGTLRVATEAARRLGSDKVEVLKNEQNYGLGGSHKVAFLRGEREGADYVAILHGDHQAKTQELHQLVDEATAHPEAAAILGSRFMLRSTLQGYSTVRTLGNVGLNAVYSVVSGHVTKDLGSGLNLFRVKELLDHRYLGFTDSLNFNNDLLLDYFHKHSPLRFVPITWSETDQVSNARNFKVGYSALKRLVTWRLGRSQFEPRPAEHYKSDRAVVS